MIKQVLLVCMAAAMARSIELYGHPYSHHGHHEAYHDAPAQYNFHYQVYDHKTGDIKSHHEERQGDQTKGEYSLVEPDGSTRVVQYSVDKHSGFNAVVHRQAGHHPAPSHGHGYGHGASYSSYSTHGSPIIAHQPLVAHHQPVIAHHQPIIAHHQPIIAHHQPIISHHRPIIAHHQPVIAHVAPGHGHARSSSSFSTHGAKVQTSTYHLAPQIKKFY